MVEAGYRKLPVGMLGPLLWASLPVSLAIRSWHFDTLNPAINKYLAIGYARKVPPDELLGVQFFQPHFALIKPIEPWKGPEFLTSSRNEFFSSIEEEEKTVGVRRLV